MKAEILAIGDEILAGDILNSNAQFLSSELSRLGVKVDFHSSVRDSEIEIPKALQNAAKRVDLVLVTGGLGPTSDDFTLEMAAKAFGVGFECDEDALEMLRNFYQKKAREVNDTNKKQAFLPVGAKPLKNRVGTAPGAYFRYQKTDFYFLPGVPKEMKAIFKDCIKPKLNQNENLQNSIIFLKCFSLPESEIQKKLSDLFTSRSHIGDVQMAFRVSFPETYLKLSTDTNLKNAHQTLQSVKQKIYERLGNVIYAESLEATLEQNVYEHFRKHKKTLAVAESCTGGLIANRLTDVSGVSEIFLGGFVTYANELKEDVLGVSKKTLNAFGAVSKECALEMVQGVYQKTKADVCVATTGIAGPSGGSADKPVGTVFIAILENGKAEVKKYNFPFPRVQFKTLTASTVLWQLLKLF